MAQQFTRKYKYYIPYLYVCTLIHYIHVTYVAWQKMKAYEKQVRKIEDNWRDRLKKVQNI